MLRLCLIMSIAAVVACSSAIVSLAASSCFCLQNPGSLQIDHFGCTARKIPNRTSEYVSCSDVPVTNHGSYTRLKDGEGLCTPCISESVSDTRDRIRGDEDQDLVAPSEDSRAPKSEQSTSPTDRSNSGNAPAATTGGADSE